MSHANIPRSRRFSLDTTVSGIREFGFGESGPKLSADFTTGTYKAGGATKTFADLFTFNRAGKAWLVKDIGLQEYEADVPRLDNGLLIEQSASNLLLGQSIYWTKQNNVTATGDSFSVAVNRTSAANTGLYYSYPSMTVGLAYTLSAYAKSVADSIILTINEGSPVKDATYTLYNEYKKFVFTATARIVSHVGFLVREGVTNIKARQLELGLYSSSYIPTEAIPVTRPADYLLNKITGKTVTGDWDSTLNLSIVAGKLVHSGYGRIRSLEIN